jgi:hypothetical protein
MKRQSTPRSRTPRRGATRQALRPAPPAVPPESPLAGTHVDPKAAHDAAGVESVAGEEDPGSALDPPAPPPVER